MASFSGVSAPQIARAAPANRQVLRHTYPRRERLDAAIDHVNTEGEEGINFTAERQPERDITPLSEATQKEINDLLVSLDKTWDADLLPLCSRIFKRPISQPADLTEMEGVKALGFLRQKAAA